MLKQLKSLRMTFIDIMRSRARGEDFFSSEEEASRRWEICNSCDHFKDNECDYCGCYMPHKININAARCGAVIDKKPDKWQI